MEYKIQTIVFPKVDRHMLCKKLFYRGDGGYLDRENGTLFLRYGQSCDLLTYLNSCSWAKWKEFTNAESISLHLIIEGQCELTYVGNTLEYQEIRRTEYDIRQDRQLGKREITFGYPDNNETLLGVEIAALGECTIYGGYFTVTVPDAKMRDVDISIATTTCRKEDYIRQNIKLIKSEILGGDDELKDHLEVHVVDNGNTLKDEEIIGDHVYLHPNPNTGGSGGFARGMMETLHQKTPATHVLLMDDDVLILPESIKRTYHLLRIMKPEYTDRFINGAMLRYECPEWQHEDLGTISQARLFEPLKPVFNHSDPIAVLRCAGAYYNDPNTYAAWWYCCIPIETVKKNGLPMPFFVRGDDSEYSLRCKAKFISMNGICLWHLGFALKFSGAMDIYQQFRNLLIAKASSDIMPDIDMHAIFVAFFKNDIRKFNYCACDLYLKAFEDFMKGPDFLENCDGEKMVKENNALSEKTYPLSEHPEISIHNIWDVYGEQLSSIFARILGRIRWSFTDNGQKFGRMPKEEKEITPAAFDFSVQITRMGGVRKYASVNPFMETVAIREMDRARYKTLMKRFKELERQYKKNKAEIERSYREKFPYFTSEEFWKKYLKLDKIGN